MTHKGVLIWFEKPIIPNDYAHTRYDVVINNQKPSGG